VSEVPAVSPGDYVADSHLLTEIRSALRSLSVSEARVAEIILDRPYEFLDWSAADLARLSATSGATVVRTCRQLGYDGLRDLRLTLARDLGFPAPAATGEPVGEGRPLVVGLFEDAARSMAAMVTPESIEGFSRAVAYLARAPRILAVAAGPSHSLAHDFAIQARLGGHPAECWSDAIMQVGLAGQLGHSDVCLAVSHSGLNSLTIEAAEAARDAGAFVVALTGYRHSRLVNIATVSIIANTFDFGTTGQAAINSAAMMLFLRGLVLGMAELGSEAGKGAVPQSPAARRIFDRFVYRRTSAMPRMPGPDADRAE
jgi:RpiR family carbohydrate utilization transcriptional regulator